MATKWFSIIAINLSNSENSPEQLLHTFTQVLKQKSKDKRAAQKKKKLETYFDQWILSLNGSHERTHTPLRAKLSL